MNAAQEGSSKDAIYYNLHILPDSFADSLGSKQALVISGDTIAAITSYDVAVQTYPNLPRIDMDGYLATPGLVNAHSHSPMSFFRGLGHNQTPSTAGKTSMIEDFFFPAEQKLSAELIEPLAYSYLVDGLRSGVTCFNDAYFFMTGVGRAVERLGLKAALGEHHADLGGPHHAGKEYWQRTRATIESWPFSANVKPMVYAHAADTVSKGLLQMLGAYACDSSLPFHMHLSQTIGERERVMQRESLSPVQYAKASGVLTEHSLLVHLLSADLDDLKCLADAGCAAVLCPQSEIIYEAAPVMANFLEAKLPFLLGTDCAASCDGSDMIAEAKFMVMLMMTQGLRPKGLLPSLFNAITEDSYRRLGFKNTGRLQPGWVADIVFFKTDLGVKPFSDPYVNFFFSLQSRHVEHVMIGGEWVLYQRHLVKTSEADLSRDYAGALAEIKQRTGLPIRVENL